MGGTLKAESEGPGKGATFTLELSYREAGPLTAGKDTEPIRTPE
jgi:hypothetical protein